MSFRALAGRLIAAGAVLWAAGAYPTWHLAGGGGLAAQTAAGAAILAVMAANAALIARYGRSDAARLAKIFLISGLARVPLSVALVVGLAAALELPDAALLIWAAVFYLGLIVTEGVWLARVLLRPKAASAGPPGDGPWSVAAAIQGPQGRSAERRTDDVADRHE